MVSVYVKDNTAPKGPASLLSSDYWKRVVIDDFGPLNLNHTGAVHHVASGDFDGCGVDAFAIACIGDRKSNVSVYAESGADVDI